MALKEFSFFNSPCWYVYFIISSYSVVKIRFVIHKQLFLPLFKLKRRYALTAVFLISNVIRYRWFIYLHMRAYYFAFMWLVCVYVQFSRIRLLSLYTRGNEEFSMRIDSHLCGWSVHNIKWTIFSWIVSKWEILYVIFRNLFCN